MSYQTIVACSSSKRLGNTRLAIGFALLVILLTGVAGCATTALSPESRMRQSVAQDFALSLASLTNVGSTLLSMSTPEHNSGFSAAFQKALRNEGFAISSEQSARAMSVSYNIESVTYEKGASERYTVNVGPLVMMRDYQRDNEGIYPMSAFEIENRQEPVSQAAEANATPTLASIADPFAALVDADAAKQTPKVSPLPGPLAAVLPENLESVERKNMHKTGVSAFGEFTRDFDSIEKQVLLFPNDSLHITNEVSSSLEVLSQQFREDSDVFSVIGCSHGNTDLDNGNALLAVGRSKRVKQFLISQGIPVNRILDEGCWAPVHYDEVMPRRGVLIELKRNAA